VPGGGRGAGRHLANSASSAGVSCISGEGAGCLGGGSILEDMAGGW
jgi:hypothetical protein